MYFLHVTIAAFAGFSGITTAQSLPWTVNFYKSADCSSPSLTSSFTGKDVYVSYYTGNVDFANAW